MHRHWSTVIRPVLELIDAARIVEIGTHKGELTVPLADWSKKTGAKIYSIDPAMQLDIRTFLHEYGDVCTLLEASSVHVLPTVETCDCVLIDGDHNWYSVLQELKLIERHMKPFPIVFLHDMHWPYARRDMYHKPERIPESNRKPMQQGMRLQMQNGKSIPFKEWQWIATEEGTEKNGVRTAVEDFLQQTSHSLSLFVVDGFYGLGILVSTEMLEKFPALQTFLHNLQTPEALKKHVENIERDAMEKEASAVYHASLAKKRATRIAELEKKLDNLEHPQQSTYSKNIQHTEKHYSQAYNHAVITELQKELAHVLQTKSWRWTLPIRLCEKWLRALLSPYTYFGLVKKVWVKAGSPFEKTVRFLRYNILGKVFPVKKPDSFSHHAVENSVEEKKQPDVAVIIVSHNYGYYLSEAIESVLHQSTKPKDIIVVDDASTDETSAIALSYADKGVQFIHGSWYAVGEARNAGMSVTSAPLLVFLDADDVLHPYYIQCGIDALASAPDAAIAYPSQQCFGESSEAIIHPNRFDWERFHASNHINTVAMVRRDALEQAGKWVHGHNQHGDWITWRNILQLGWTAVKSDGIQFYRKHSKNMHMENKEKRTYAERTGLYEEPATLFLALSGREWAWPLMTAFLEEQTFPHEQIQLVILDTSHNESFGTKVKEWMLQCDYRGVTYEKKDVGPKGIADMDRNLARTAMQRACAVIYNFFARRCQTTLAFIVEDDVIPPLDAFNRLIGHFEEKIVSVSGYYRHRYKDEPIAWNWDKGKPIPAIEKTGTEQIGGNGFGCVVLRGEHFKRTVFKSGPPFGNYDQQFYYELSLQPHRHALIDWSCRCKHFSDMHTWH